MTPERAFIIWLSKRDFMVVKKHRAEVRAHIVKALAAQAGEAGTAETPKSGSVHEHAVPEGDAPMTGLAI